MTNQGGEVDAGLATLRNELDAIDGRLLELLRQRLDCCRSIAEYKRRHGIAMMQPDRVAFVQERAVRYAEAHALDPTFARNLYQMVVTEACRLEDIIISGTGEHQRAT